MSFDKRLIAGIILAVSLWGIWLAVGAYLLNHNPWRAVVVLACVFGFIGFWLLMLQSRKKRIGEPKDDA